MISKKEHDEYIERLGVSLYTLVTELENLEDPSQGEAALQLLLTTIATLVFAENDKEILRGFIPSALHLLGEI